MIVLFLFFLGFKETLAGNYTECCVNPIIIGGNISGLCPCENDYILGWTYDGECDCKCIPPNHNLVCHDCPDVLQRCAKTCCYLDVVCDDGVCKAADSLDFATVAKIAILFALIVTCLAVLVAFLRAFLLPRWCQGGRIRSTTATSDSRSLNSVQRFVVDRLRSRPPPYEHQPEKPPSYEECMSADTETPPAYRISVITLSSEPPPYSPPTELSSNSEHIELVPMQTGPVILDPEALTTVVSPEPDMEDFAVVGNAKKQINAADNEAFVADAPEDEH